MDAVVMCKCIPDPSVSHVRMLGVDLFCFSADKSVEGIIPAVCLVLPFIIGCPVDLQYPAHLTYRIVIMRF